MKKECKTTCKTVEGCKTNSIDSWEDTCKTVEGDITNGFDSLGDSTLGFVVERRKSNFCDGFSIFP